MYRSCCISKYTGAERYFNGKLILMCSLIFSYCTFCDCVPQVLRNHIELINSGINRITNQVTIVLPTADVL